MGNVLGSGFGLNELLGRKRKKYRLVGIGNAETEGDVAQQTQGHSHIFKPIAPLAILVLKRL